MEPLSRDEFRELRPRPLANGGVVHDYYGKPISQSRAVELLALLPAEQLVSFTASLGHQLTVTGRVIVHSRDDYPDEIARLMMTALNEMFHGITLQIGGLAGRDSLVYDAADFCDSMYSKGRKGGFEEYLALDFSRALLWSLSRAGLVEENSDDARR